MAPTVTERTWDADEDQALLLLNESVDEILIGGRKGSGKTDGLLAFSISRRRYPGSKGLFLRRSLADLQREGGAILRSKELLAGTAAVYQEQRHRWRFPDGGGIEFGYLRDDGDIYNYAGASYDDICLTQAEQITGWQYRVLMGALRTTRKDLKPVVRLDANPGGRGHPWLKARFVDIAAPGTVWTDPGSGKTRMFISARAQSRYLNPGYLKWLDELPEPWRSAWRDGRWDVFAGQYFGEWLPAIHTCPPFEIPQSWQRWMGYDWGSASPAWFGWFARAPWGTVYLYHEWYVARQDDSGRWIGLGMTVDAQVERAKEQMALAPPAYTGPDMFTRSAQTGEDNATAAARKGLPMQPAMHDRIQGWQRIKRALQVRDVQRGGVVVPEPELIIFNTCRHIIRTLPLLVGGETNPEDVADGQEDHPPDGLRYGLAPVIAGGGGAGARVVLGPPRATSRWLQ